MLKASGMTVADLKGTGAGFSGKGGGATRELQELVLSVHMWRVLGQLRHTETKTSVPLPPVKLMLQRDARAALGLPQSLFGNVPMAVQLSATPSELASSSLADTTRAMRDALSALCSSSQSSPRAVQSCR